MDHERYIYGGHIDYTGQQSLELRCLYSTGHPWLVHSYSRGVTKGGGGITPPPPHPFSFLGPWLLAKRDLPSRDVNSYDACIRIASALLAHLSADKPDSFLEQLISLHQLELALSSPQIHPALQPVSTPLHIDQWVSLLNQHLDSQFTDWIYIWLDGGFPHWL